jgi:dihydropteroate synthase
MIIGNKNFDTKNNVYIMGILNVTPDSFSDGGNFNSIDKALFHTEEMIKQGADIIDVGGESTRPNHTKISDQEEIERVYPILSAIKKRFDVPLSLDSYKSNVIKENLCHIDLVNDIWGLKYDDKMAEVVANANIPYCLMHNRDNQNYNSFFEDFINDIKESLDIAQKAGIKKENIILDGGVGFAKSYEQNLQVINRTDKLCSLGYPVMVATSRKSVIGLTLDKEVTDRVTGTVATSVIGVMKGASFVRVHDITENCDAIKMTKSIMEEHKWMK